MRIVEARGPVVEALKKHDPGLRVRWSWEWGKWVVDAPWLAFDTSFVPPPVRYEQTSAGWVETLEPERSERRILYADRRYVVCRCGRIDWPLYHAIVRRDGQRQKKGLVGVFDAEFEKEVKAQKRQEDARKDRRVYEGWDRFKFIHRKHPELADGAGVSTKGMEGV